MSDKLPVVAYCKKCGREFVWLPEKRKTDPYLPQGAKYGGPTCEGELVRVDKEIRGLEGK